MKQIDPYDVLGVAPECDFAALKSAYRARVRANHPDLAGDEEARDKASARMLEINAAWHLVRDPQVRAAFDAERRESRPKRPGLEPSSDMSPAQMARRAARSKKKSSSKLTHIHFQNALRLFYEQKRPDEAAELCRTIIRLEFRHVEARELLSEIYMSQAQWKRARALLRQATELAPTNLALQRKLRVLEGKTPRDSPSTTPADMESASRAAAPPTAATARVSLWKRLFSRRKKSR